MNDIVKRDPFGMDTLFDDLMKGFWVRPMRWPSEMPAMQNIRMDLKEDEKAYTVHAEMPGVKKEDIHVTLDGNVVSIAAEVKKVREEKEGEKVLRGERHFGRVARSFTLAQDVDEDGASARFSDGVLELVLPKKAGSETRRLTIE
ncbi:MAG TPA: Hsp20/alpha crystallin family protein [Thiobacillaceae bacterium]|nr:Hsp20/alpha crystallin family protein [Thiobacillaceae bacterium]HNU65356.1 Hsp20/alpha crystallin family protein [Thiobacillaceae bacterium]